jgi:hypothetical protein
MTHDEHDSKWVKDRSVNMESIRDLNRRWGSLDYKLHRLDLEGKTSRTHMQFRESSRRHEKRQKV